VRLFPSQADHPDRAPKIGPVPSLKLWKICAKFMGQLHRWRQARPHWEFAAGLILKAAESARRADVTSGGWCTPCGVTVSSDHTGRIKMNFTIKIIVTSSTIKSRSADCDLQDHLVGRAAAT
jgi:hypothetical protein